MKRYGIPYKGSKNSIAKDIVSFLPSGGTLVDLFAGGCAITHAAVEACEGLVPKWNRIICNDISPMPIGLFRDSVDGEYTVKKCKQWIGRNDFERLKDKNAWVRFCWSFGNNGITYLYAKEIEPWKRALHGAYVLKDYTLIEEIIGELPREARMDICTWIKRNHEEVKQKYINWYGETYLENIKTEYLPDVANTEEAIAELKKELKRYMRNALQKSGLRAVDVDRHLGTKGMAGHYFGNSQWEFPTLAAYEKLKEILLLDMPYPLHLTLLESLQRLQSLESLQRLQSLQSLQSLQRLQRLQSLQSLESSKNIIEFSTKDYREVEIPIDAIIYCDIPYENTDCGCYEKFDHNAFFDWVAKQTRPIYISSYHINDDRFKCVWEKQKRCQSQAGGKGKLVTERIYTVKNKVES